MFEDGNLSIFVGKCTKFWLKKKNSPEEPGRVQPGGEDEHHDVIYKNKKNKNFFFCLNILGIIMHLLNLVLSGQLLLLVLFMV